MRFLFLTLFFTTSFLYAQISNVRQITEKNRIIITYDLSGGNFDVYNLKITAINNNGETITPHAIVGDINAVKSGKDRSIWWQTPLDGLTPAGWKINLTTINIFNILWIFVQGGPTGDFYISATEVTFDQFDAFCEETGYKKPSANFGRGKQPVINVNVDDAQAFCKWLSEKNGTTIRLPEENEWEFAAKGGNKSNGYSYSGSNNVDNVAWYGNNSGNMAHEVATKKPNELGIYDMSGNVWERCGTSGAVRGGSWSHFADLCQVSYSIGNSPVGRPSLFGFRILQKK